MRRVTFDYQNTCPIIDKRIKEAESTIFSFIDDLISDICPYIPVEYRKLLSADNAERLYSELQDVFEETRSTNEDMRREAERQIESLHEDIANLEHEIGELK